MRQEKPAEDDPDGAVPGDGTDAQKAGPLEGGVVRQGRLRWQQSLSLRARGFVVFRDRRLPLVPLALSAIASLPLALATGPVAAAGQQSVQQADVGPRLQSERLALEPVPAGPVAQAHPDAGGREDLPPDAAADKGDHHALSAPQERRPFGLVGVSVPAAQAAPGLTVQVRTRADGAWSAWEELEASSDEGPDPSSPEAAAGAGYVSTEPLVALDADAVQVSVGAPAGFALPDAVTATTIDPGTSPADAAATPQPSSAPQPVAAQSPALPQPAVVNRAAWGADESWRTRNPGCGTPSYAPSLKAATLHHTAGVNDYTPSDVPGIVRGIYAFHTAAPPAGRGWCDIGYNALVDKWGRLFEGRYGGLQRGVIGAHAGGFNTGTFGISMIGDYESVNVPAATLESVARMMAWKFSLADVDPNGRTTLTSAGSTRYAEGAHVDLPTVFGHRDVSLTECPGDDGYRQLGSVRARATQFLTNSVTVQAWYRDFLGRSADPGATTWRTQLDQGTDRSRVLGSLLTSREYLSREVDLSYRSTLGRSADGAGLNGWVSAVQAGRFTLEDVDNLLYQSEEFFQRSGGTNTSYVGQVYRRVLGRPAGGAEAGAWAADIERYGRGAVVAGIWHSVEAGRHRVTANYETLLARAPDAGGLQGWTAYELVYGDAAVKVALATSVEYMIRAAQRF